MQKKNIFLDYLSPDNWKTYATIPNNENLLSQCKHIIIRNIKRSITVAVLLADQYCLLPPAFIIQSPISYQAVLESAIYLDERKIFLPLRENSIDRYISKKISEYTNVKATHIGFFMDDHWKFLSQHQDVLIHREAAMGNTIANQWIALPDTDPIWRPILNYSRRTADQLRPLPSLIKRRGESVTLEAIEAEIGCRDESLRRAINQAIQHEYINAYLKEYNATILANAPPKPLNENYLVHIESCYYDYMLFSEVLNILGIREIILEAHPGAIVDFMGTSAYAKLKEAYWDICCFCCNNGKVKKIFAELVEIANPPSKRLFPSFFHNSVPRSVVERINTIVNLWEEKRERQYIPKGAGGMTNTLYQVHNQVDNDEPFIFISHKSDDKKYGDAIRAFLIGLGIKDEQLIYTSHPLNRIPTGEKIFAYLRKHINSRSYMVFLWSDKYLDSPACLNEMGAAWVVQADYTHMYVPSFDFNNPKYRQCAIDTDEMGIVLKADTNCRIRMLEFKDKIQTLFNLSSDEKKVTSLLDDFIRNIS